MDDNVPDDRRQGSTTSLVSSGLHRDEEIEDTQIESSMPFYLDHIFGAHIGASQTLMKNCPNNSSPQVISILDSQGFLTEPLGEVRCCPQNFHASNHSLTIGDNDKQFSGSSNIPVSSSPPPCGSPNSLVLFPSPTIPAPSNTNIKSCNSTKIAPLKTPKSCVHMTPCLSDRNETSNKWKRKQLLCVEEYMCPSSCTVLAECNTINKTVDVLVLVIQVNSPMDVICRKGPMAGSTVPMSSLLVADPTRSYFKLSLWREAATWAERISIGDIVYFKFIRLKDWKNEVVGTTVMHSSVLNLHQPDKKLPAKVQQFIPEKSLSDLMAWGRKHYTYLFDSYSIPKSQREVKFQTSQNLMGDSLVHFRAKLLCLVTCRVALLADQPGIDVHLHLLSSAASQWYSQLSSGIGQVWEFMYMAVMCEGTQTQNSVCSLQTTSHTCIRMLSETCDVACEILKKLPSVGSTSESLVLSHLSIDEIISSKTSGIFKIKAKAVSMEFFLPNGLMLSVGTMLTQSPPEMLAKLCQAVYVGCESCSQPLSQDENGVYCQCMPCIMKFPGGYPGLSYFFRPLLVTLSDTKLTSITVIASHMIVPKVLKVSGKDVVQASLSSNEEKLQVLYDLFISASWVIRCLVTKDENSFIEELAFCLLDVH